MGLGGANEATFDTHDAALVHMWDFGDKQQNNLMSSVNYFNQSGTFSIERLRWDERLRMKHTSDFETRLLTSLDQQTTGEAGESFEQKQYRVEGGFTHRLYKSLITDGYVGAQFIDRSDGSTSNEYFGHLSFAYTKKVPYGTLAANLGGGYDNTDNTAQSAVIHVINQARAFDDALPIVISAPNILPNSIVITDPSGLILFHPGRDYTLRTAPGVVDIFRVVGGRIPDGSTVLIDYDLAPQAANTITTANFNTGAHYTIEEGILKGLSPYIRYTKQDQTISSEGTTTFIPDSFTDVLVGSEYKRFGLTLGAEWEMHDSTLQPYDAMRLWAIYERRVGKDTTLTGHTAYTIIDYTEPTNHVTLLTVSGTAAQRFRRELNGSVTVLYRDETDDISGKTTGWEEQAQVRWTHRQTSVYVNFRNSSLDTDAQSTTFQFLEVGLRREF